MLASIEATPARTGVRVSWRAKKAGASTFTNANAGRPKLSADSDNAAMCASCTVNAPCWNRVATSGSASSTRPSIAGTAISNVVRSPQSKALENPAWSVLT